MLISVPSCLKRAIDTRESQSFTALADTSSEDVLRMRSKILNDIKEGLQYIFQTQNETTLCFSSCDNEIEAVFSNLIDKNDIVLIGVIGDIGYRAASIAKNYGADVRLMHTEPGTILTYTKINEYIEKHQPHILFLAHGDPATGVLQPIAMDIGNLCRKNDCLLIVDAVNTIGSAALFTDAWKIDVTYTSAHQTLGGPPGLVPFTFGARAMANINRRKTPMKARFWNVKTIADTWGRTGTGANVSLKTMLEMRQALVTICEIGLGKNIERFYRDSRRLHTKLQDFIGLEMFIEHVDYRLPAVVVMRLPQRLNGKQFAKLLLGRYSIKIKADSNFTTDHVIRIVLNNHQNINNIIKALHDALTMMTPTYVNPIMLPYY